MTAIRLFYIECEGERITDEGTRHECGESAGSEHSIREARRNARSYGFTYKNRRDLCPVCSAKEPDSGN